MKKYLAASTGTSSRRSSMVMNSPARLDIFTGWPFLSSVTSCRIRTSRSSLGIPKRLDPGLHAPFVAVVVGAEDVDELREAPLQLVPMVCQVRSDVGVLAVVLDENAVLIVAVLGGAEPEGALALVGEALLAHPLDELLHRAGVAQGLL